MYIHVYILYVNDLSTYVAVLLSVYFNSFENVSTYYNIYGTSNTTNICRYIFEYYTINIG